MRGPSVGRACTASLIIAGGAAQRIEGIHAFCLSPGRHKAQFRDSDNLRFLKSINVHLHAFRESSSCLFCSFLFIKYSSHPLRSHILQFSQRISQTQLPHAPPAPPIPQSATYSLQPTASITSHRLLSWRDTPSPPPPPPSPHSTPYTT